MLGKKKRKKGMLLDNKKMYGFRLGGTVKQY